MFIRLYNGKRFDFTAEDYSNLTLDECVHATPGVNRWCGQVKSNVSLSRHSNLVGYLADAIVELAGGNRREQDAAMAAGLCHDFVETTTNDIPAPLKQYLTFDGQPYKTWEEEQIIRLTRGILSRSSRWKGDEDIVVENLINGTVSLADRMALSFESLEFHPLWETEHHIQMPPEASPLLIGNTTNLARLFLREPEYQSVGAFQDYVRIYLA